MLDPISIINERKMPSVSYFPLLLTRILSVIGIVWFILTAALSYKAIIYFKGYGSLGVLLYLVLGILIWASWIMISFKVIREKTKLQFLIWLFSLFYHSGSFWLFLIPNQPNLFVLWFFIMIIISLYQLDHNRAGHKSSFIINFDGDDRT